MHGEHSVVSLLPDVVVDSIDYFLHAHSVSFVVVTARCSQPPRICRDIGTGGIW